MKKMGEYSRSKEFKKKDFQGTKDHRRTSAVILSKYDKESGYSRDHGLKKSLLTANKEEKQQPTILIKTREGERAVSPNSKSSSTSTPKKDESNQPVYQLQSKPSATENAAPTEMTSPVKLLDLETLSLVDNCLEYLSDQNEYLVVGIVGYQGVGKSTIMSLLADPKSLNDGKFLFGVEKPSDIEIGLHRTDGIDMYVTKNRVIYLDTQPIMSPSVHVKLLQQMDSLSGKKFPHSDYSYECSDIEIQSFQIITFLFSVCHILLFVQDFWFDPDALRILQAAYLLKPPSVRSDAVFEHFAHIILLHNKCQSSDFEPGNIKEMQEIYMKAFQNSGLFLNTGFGIANGEINPTLNFDSCGKLVNLYLLPEMGIEPCSYNGHSGFADLIRQLRRQIISTERIPLAPTEKNWFHYAVKIWESIKKGSFFNEYHRLANV